jgi:hypothetical protein
MLSMLLAAIVPAVLPNDAPPTQSWVTMAPGGSVVRVLTRSDACPVVQVDGQSRQTVLRAAPADLPERSNKAHTTGPTAFATRICELGLPRTARRASLAGQALPLPHPRIDRIVLIGDTGCRIKAADDAMQDCNVPAAWPFAAIAAHAAQLHPDLVLHVGDYLYRENPCPAGHQGCAGAPWGYGEVGWRADFLDPAAPLLNAAPWIMVRGNHEECARAGQGWWRLLDPHALQAGSDCGVAADDQTGDHSDPYAVSLGNGAQIIVADLIQLASGKPDNAAVAAQFGHDMAMIDALSSRANVSFATAHFPFNPVLWKDRSPGAVAIGGKPIRAYAMPPLPHVRAMLAGHIHLFQFARFADRPTQVITGFSGTQEDAALAPDSLSQATGKPSAAPLQNLTTIADRFGYALMERHGDVWRLTVFAADGAIMGRFVI